MKFSKKLSRVSRRNVLTAVGSVGLASTGVAAKPSEQSPHEKFQTKITKANKLREKAGPEARERYLHKHNIKTAKVNQKFNLQPDKQGPTTQEVDCVDGNQCDGDIDTTMSLSYDSNSNEYYAELMVSIKYQKDSGALITGGEDPVDAMGIAWHKDEWKVIDPESISASTQRSSRVVTDDDNHMYDGVAFNLDDEGLCKFDSPNTNGSEEWSAYAWGGVYLIPGDENQTDSEILGSYIHTWNENNIDFSVSYPAGVGVSGSTQSKHEKTTTEKDGDTPLRLTSGDMSCGGCPSPN